MKKLLLATAAIAAISSSASAVERFPNWYVGLSAGVAEQTKSDFDAPAGNGEIDWDTGHVLSASLGYQPPSFGGFRAEAEISTHKQDASGSGFRDSDVRANVIAGNAYYDFYNSSRFTPYVGAGLGYANFDLNGSSTSPLGGDDDKWVYQLMAGVGYEAASIPNVQWTLGYRYFAPFDDVDAGSSGEYEYDNHSVELGAKFRF